MFVDCHEIAKLQKIIEYLAGYGLFFRKLSENLYGQSFLRSKHTIVLHFLLFLWILFLFSSEYKKYYLSLQHV